MLAYTLVGVSDIEQAKAFYEGLFAKLNAKLMLNSDRVYIYGTGQGAMFGFCKPHNGEANAPGNGTMASFGVDSHAEVDELYQHALELGATDEGEPGYRVPDVFYGAYVRDPDGNKLCFCNITMPK